MTSMKIVQFPRPPPTLSIYTQSSSTPFTLYVQFQTTLPFQMINNQLKENNPRMTIICYQVLPSGSISFSISTH